ncbi:MFS transporter [Trujillonella endophytica]|uniref:Drug resistance transporter, EmrB/QacA subfamily n=1 Tax=Trujillonella endophytica TaxID=673521 RepID=A0A1H8UVV3_9ACTN|nr:MFS transporter [Trujillella endophytica]SEP07305.1 drug resistance transporter, EmrB/QacA subfamily [Trujillella endophytica]
MPAGAGPARPGDADPGGGVALGTPRGRRLIAATVLASGMALLDASAVNVALPAIGDDLDASLSGLQWTVTGYTLALAALVLLGGSLGDRFGRRRVFLVGVAWFAVASLLCGLAQDTGQLVGARVVQGVGAALLTPGSLSLIQASVRPADRARAIGLWSGLGGIAGLAGPFLGGVLVDAVSWRLVFLLNVPVAVVVLVVASRHVPESRAAARPGRFDVAGAAIGALALGAVTHALIRAGDPAAGVEVVVWGTAGLLAGAGFVVRERRATAPLLPLRLFADRQFTGANLTTLAVYGGLGGVLLFLVLQLQTVLGYDATAAGAAMLPSIAMITLLSSRAGALAARIGPRRPMTAGPLIAAAGTAWLATVDGRQPYALDVLPGSLLLGLGMAATVAPLTATVLAAAPDSLTGAASGVNNAVARAAQLLAVAALPVAVGLGGSDYADPVTFATAHRTAMLAGAALFAVGGALAWATVRDDVLRS